LPDPPARLQEIMLAAPTVDPSVLNYDGTATPNIDERWRVAYGCST